MNSIKGTKTVGELKKFLENVSDDTILVVPDHDHSFRPAFWDTASAQYSLKYYHFSEYYSEDQLEDDDVVLEVLVVS